MVGFAVGRQGNRSNVRSVEYRDLDRWSRELRTSSYRVSDRDRRNAAPMARSYSGDFPIVDNYGNSAPPPPLRNPRSLYSALAGQDESTDLASTEDRVELFDHRLHDIDALLQALGVSPITDTGKAHAAMTEAAVKGSSGPRNAPKGKLVITGAPNATSPSQTGDIEIGLSKFRENQSLLYGCDDRATGQGPSAATLERASLAKYEATDAMQDLFDSESAISGKIAQLQGKQGQKNVGRIHQYQLLLAALKFAQVDLSERQATMQTGIAQASRPVATA